MKKWMTIIITVIMAISLVACGSNNNDTSNIIKNTETKEGVTDKNVVNGEEKSKTTKSNILVVYFSREGSSNVSEGFDATSSASLGVGNTTIIAKDIQEMTNGKLFQIVTANPYPEDYDKTTAVAKEEQNKNARPKLAAHVENMDSYDVVFVGYPNWWGTIPMPVFTFLEEYNFSGKTIIPFCTHEGSGLGSSVSDIAKLSENSKVVKGLAIRGKDANTEKAKKNVADWLKSIGITE